jgi:DNA polymerase sigma
MIMVTAQPFNSCHTGTLGSGTIFSFVSKVYSFLHKKLLRSLMKFFFFSSFYIPMRFV